MEDKFFDIDEMMVDYAEMSGFDFNSGNYLVNQNMDSEYSQEPSTFKHGSFDVVDMLKSMFAKPSLQKR